LFASSRAALRAVDAFDALAKRNVHLRLYFLARMLEGAVKAGI